MQDSYIISEDTIKDPPSSFRDKLKFLGPGFILSASIVGSGELIATTILGGKAGFTALWIIIISCLVKVTIQLEFGRHAVLTGLTPMQAFDRLPGPRWGKAKWPVWIVFLLLFPKVLQVGGILGGTAIVLSMLYDGLSIHAWAIFAALMTAVLIYNGKYNAVEKISLIMMALFTLLTLSSLYAVQFTEYHFSWEDIRSGFMLRISPSLIMYAIGAFGITGVASDEILAYNYWCIEKGYARYVGPAIDNEAWRKRAHGWIKIMYLDATVAMIIYTTVTVTFYLLGAAVLHQREEIPFGNEVIETLALIYTQSLGAGVRSIYLVGAFFVLFSSLYATLAAWTRLLTDIFGRLQWIDFGNLAQRKRSISVLALLLPFIWAMVYLFIQLPVIMVLSGGIVGSLLLFLVVYAAYQFKYNEDQPIPSGKIYTAAFWLSVFCILAVGIYGLIKVFE
jgi:manganese transport protein